MDLSNKTLAIFLVAAIVISLGGTLMSLTMLDNMKTATGYATLSATAGVNLSINSSVSIQWVIAGIAFGNGSVRPNETYCSMFVNTTNTSALRWKNGSCVNFVTTMPDPLVLENNGNFNASINLNASNTAATFISGTTVTPQFQYYVTQNVSLNDGGELASCADVGGPFPQNFTDVNVTALGTLICNDLQTLDTNDSLKVGARITIPLNAPAGAKQAYMVATATG